jgi:hypothetical protein
MAYDAEKSQRLFGPRHALNFPRCEAKLPVARRLREAAGAPERLNTPVKLTLNKTARRQGNA